MTCVGQPDDPAPDDCSCLPDYPASESPIPGVSGQSLAQAIRQVTSTPVQFFENFAAMQAALGDILREGDLFLTLGAGSIWTVGQNYLDGEGGTP